MEKFKVGDKIKRIHQSIGIPLIKGEIYTVSSVDEYGKFKLKEVNNSGHTWHSEYFELVNEKVTNWKKRIAK